MKREYLTTANCEPQNLYRAGPREVEGLFYIQCPHGPPPIQLWPVLICILLSVAPVVVSSFFFNSPNLAAKRRQIPLNFVG